MTEYLIEAKSRQELRNIALGIRKSLGLESVLYFPIVEVLDVFAEIFDDFNYEIVPGATLPGGAHADTDITRGHIRIAESVYERACRGEGRDRMTIAHELGHYFTVCVCGFRLERSYDQSMKVASYSDPEWQAKCLGGELMIQSDLIKNLTATEIAEKCGVSLDAARYQLSRLY